VRVGNRVRSHEANVVAIVLVGVPGISETDDQQHARPNLDA
jgi:hypothetical protein